MIDSLTLLERVFLWLVPAFFALSVHELAHGLTAFYLGDTTAKLAGRLTLNPIRHFDLLGSFIVPVAFLLVGGFMFGWLKPVPVLANNLRQPKRDMVIVAAAGPFANFLMTLAWAFVMKLGLWLALSLPVPGLIMVYMGAAGIFINAAIMMLNLLPLLPLDGGRIVAGLLPERWNRWMIRMEPFGLPILLLMIIVGMLGKVIWPMMAIGMAVATQLAEIPVELLLKVWRTLLAGN